MCCTEAIDRHANELDLLVSSIESNMSIAEDDMPLTTQPVVLDFLWARYIQQTNVVPLV